jgi:hypothetical protein
MANIDLVLRQGSNVHDAEGACSMLEMQDVAEQPKLAHMKRLPGRIVGCPGPTAIVGDHQTLSSSLNTCLQFGRQNAFAIAFLTNGPRIWGSAYMMNC